MHPYFFFLFFSCSLHLIHIYNFLFICNNFHLWFSPLFPCFPFLPSYLVVPWLQRSYVPCSTDPILPASFVPFFPCSHFPSFPCFLVPSQKPVSLSVLVSGYLSFLSAPLASMFFVFLFPFFFILIHCSLFLRVDIMPLFPWLPFSRVSRFWQVNKSIIAFGEAVLQGLLSS